MREIVGAKIGNTITNNLAAVKAASACGRLDELYDRKQMEFMAGCDLGRNWELMAKGPTLFCIGDNGQPFTPNG